jgi:hypothetical protein
MYVHLLHNGMNRLLSWWDVARVTINMLPHVALLKIFDFYVDEAWIEEWYTLVHVCQKWRNIVFGSPRRLDLRLYCTAGTPMREMLDVWPLLPIVVWSDGHEKWGMDNIIAALGHRDRICRINLWRVPSSYFENVLAALERPFPELTRLLLGFEDEVALVDPDLFLGGSVLRLQTLWLDNIPLPGLPKLLFSATHLVRLDLWRIPHSGYFSPKAMATCLSVLIRLERLGIEFKSPRSRPDGKSRRPPPQTRTLLPVLTELWFKGAGEYLEDLVALIDSPLLGMLDITLFHQLIFDTPRLTQFISRTPNLRICDRACVVFSDRAVLVTFPYTFDSAFKLTISCRWSDWQLSSLVQFFNPSFPQDLIPALEHLYIFEKTNSRPCWQDDIESDQWLELLRPFTAVKALYVSHDFAPRIAPVLQELVGERATEVLPALRTLFLEKAFTSGPVQEAIVQFVAARQLASRPMTISRWKRGKDWYEIELA